MSNNQFIDCVHIHVGIRTRDVRDKMLSLVDTLTKEELDDYQEDSDLFPGGSYEELQNGYKMTKENIVFYINKTFDEIEHSEVQPILFKNWILYAKIRQKDFESTFSEFLHLPKRILMVMDEVK